MEENKDLELEIERDRKVPVNIVGEMRESFL